MTTIRVFKTGSAFAVEEADHGLIELLKKRGYKPTTISDALGTRVLTGEVDIEKLKALLTDFYGENSGITLHVFSEGSSTEYQSIQLS